MTDCFYEWIDRASHQWRQVRPGEEIRGLFIAFGGTHGRRRIAGDLRNAGR